MEIEKAANDVSSEQSSTVTDVERGECDRLGAKTKCVNKGGCDLKGLRCRTSHCDTDMYTTHRSYIYINIILLYDVGPLIAFTPFTPHARGIIFCSFLRDFWNKRSLKRSFVNALIIAGLPIQDNLAMRSLMDFAKLLGKIKTRISATDRE